jgi:DNA-binding LacI/PurR family transcriptional regulator
MVTMVDVARKAGVSVSTVSYVLTGARPISASTRARVEKVIHELGYTPNALARGLKGKRSKIIAMLYPTRTRGIDLSGLEYILGASDLAQAHGYHLLLWTTDADAVDDLSRYVRQGLLDGAVVMQVKLHDERIDVLRRAQLTFAMIGRLAQSDGIDFADTDTDQCARVAVDYLAGIGHRHIGCLNPPKSDLDAGLGIGVRIRDSVKRAARSRGLRLTNVACEDTAAAGGDALERMLTRDPEISAVVAFNEQAVPGIMAAAETRGWSVPEDLSVLSIVMTAQAALMMNPPMTTVSPSAGAIGRAGVDALIQRLEGRLVHTSQMLFEGELTVRGTTGPARKTDTTTRRPRGRNESATARTSS